MNTKTKPVWSTFRPKHFDSVLSIKSGEVLDCYLDWVDTLFIIKDQFYLVSILHFHFSPVS